MSVHKESSDEQDPDYASPAPSDETQQKLYEENARTNTARKIVTIVEKEFSKEIDLKEKEVLQIQDQLHKALKTLHLLRYVIITNFYNREQCLVPHTGKVEQTRIHPAIKRLIGKSPKHLTPRQDDLAIPSTSTDPRFANADVPLCVKTESDSAEETLKRLSRTSEIRDNETAEKRRFQKIENESGPNDEQPPKKVPRYIPPKNGVPEGPCPSRGVHHKVRKRIVVGNISKWIPPDWREDAASHKWTMYVRGNKEEADISDFVSKVRFFLHPSYQPNDVVEVTSPPFHLSRQGWGEFPLRVQLHFKNVLNKPMDIIHYLKLDRTYTGLQTLGSETVVDMWVHTAILKSLDKPSNSDSRVQGGPISKDENVKTDVSIANNTFQKLESENVRRKHSNDNESLNNEHCESKTSNEQSKSCVEIDHNYTSSACREETVQRGSFEKTIEKNITMKHSPSGSIESKTALEENVSTNLPNNANSAIVPCSKTDSVLHFGDTIEDHEFPLTLSHDFTDQNKNNEHNSIPLLLEDKLNNLIRNNASSTVNEGSSKITQISIKKPQNQKSLLKKSQNGGITELPIKLVKCNDKVFFVTNVGKLINAKKVDQGDIDGSTSGLVNVSVNKIQPSNVKVQASEIPKIIPEKITVRNDLFPKNQMIKIKDPQNLINTAAAAGSSAKTSDKYTIQKSVGQLKNIQKLEVQSLASSLKEFPSKLEPLKITIPPAFVPNKKKQILVLKNNRLISVNATSLLKPKSENKSSNSEECIKPLPSSNVDSTKLINHGPIGRGISLLKKANNSSAKLDNNKLDSKPAALKMNTTNSLILNAIRDVPALRIATPMYSVRPEEQNENNDSLTKSQKITESSKTKLKKFKLDDTNDLKCVKAKVTLGKDRHKILSKKEIYEEVIRSLERVQIKDILGALKFIIKRMPFVTENASDPEYKSIHPYACTKEDEFYNYNIGKQRAMEWYRAKMVRSLLRKKGFSNDELWSVKEIIIWSRLHGHTPFRSSFGISRPGDKTVTKTPDASKMTLSTHTEPTFFTSWLESVKDLKSAENGNDSDIEVDIINVVEPTVKMEVLQGPDEKSVTKMELELPGNLVPQYAFVSKTAREIGVQLEPEEIVPGVSYCAAGRVILQAVQCLADDLVRLSLSRAWERSSNKCPETIAPNDVRSALSSREEFDIFTNAGLASQRDNGD